MAKTRKNPKSVAKSGAGQGLGILSGGWSYHSNRKTQSKVRVKRVSWRDEEIEGMSVSDVPEFQDPAILVVKEIIKVCYTKEELLKLRDVPLSKKKPDFLDSSEVSPSIFDLRRWNFEGKNQQSGTGDNNAPNERNNAVPTDDHRRRSGADPRERVRKESDGIILSPQRRSFISGCFVPTRSGAGEGVRSTSGSGQPSGGHSDGHIGIREIQPSGSRRIGSGRILRDNWDFNDKPDSEDYGGNSFRNQRGDRDEKYERRSFGREFEMTRDRDRNEPNNKDRRGNSRFDRRRISENREQEEPEWFSGGPISQNDTIELRGFDDADRPGKKKLSPSRVKRAKEWSKKKNNAEVPEETKEESKAEAISANKANGADDKQKTEQDEKKTDEKAHTVVMNEQAFNFDEILQCDNIPGLLTNGTEEEGDTQAKSRFSRWFKKPDSPEEKKQQDSRRSSIHDDHHLIIKDLLKDISEPSVSIPGDSDAYFAPISPAGNTNANFGSGRPITLREMMKEQQQGMSIMEMLQRGKAQQQQVEPGINTHKQSTQMTGKILSLDELEAKMRQNTETAAGIQQKHQQQKPDEEMTAAFKRLLVQAQIGGHSMDSNGPMNKSQPMSLLEMLNHSQQQDEAARLSAANVNQHLLVGPTSPNINHHHQVHMGNNLQLKMQQAQYQQQQKQLEMLNKLINATTVGTSAAAGQMRSSPSIHDIGAQSRELLSRPEAQAILQGLKRGEITTQHLYTQLANPALQPRHREMLATILKVQGAYGGPSPRVLSPVPLPPSAAASHHMYQQQQQQLRVSPLPPNAMHQRIPSPRELQVHTQNILQRALIKKKLEEQQENYRKKQELQRGNSPASSSAGTGVTTKSVSSPTPLAFTPTSVLRKMTADKDDGKENKIIGDGKIPPGRPLTGIRPQPQQPQAQSWNSQFPTVKQPAGRPIVKANNNYQTAEQFFSQQQQQRMFMQAAAAAQTQPLQSQVQQQQRKPSGAGQYSTGQVPMQTGMGQPSQYSSYPTNTNQQFTQQQLRAQHQHRPANQQQPGQQQQQQMGYQQQQIGQQQGMGSAAWHHLFNSTQTASRNNPANMGRANDLSPTTSDQLARWFSPDLLERARGGELPSTAGLGQNALSLEEIERQTAPPVHN